MEELIRYDEAEQLIWDIIQSQEFDYIRFDNDTGEIIAEKTAGKTLVVDSLHELILELQSGA